MIELVISVNIIITPSESAAFFEFHAIVDYSILNFFFNIIFAMSNPAQYLLPFISILIESILSLVFILVLFYYRKEIRDFYFKE